jgi:hypothetical protein
MEIAIAIAPVQLLGLGAVLNVKANRFEASVKHARIHGKGEFPVFQTQVFSKCRKISEWRTLVIEIEKFKPGFS